MISRRKPSAMQLKKFYGKGCRVYAAHVLEATENDTPRLEGFHVVREFMNVFPNEIPGFPPKRNIDLTFELVPSKAPVSKTPYRVSTPEMRELKMQLQEFWGKKHIRPSVSPWGAPDWFEKEKDDTLQLCIGSYR